MSNEKSKPDKELVTVIACALIYRMDEKEDVLLVNSAERIAREIESRNYPSIRDAALKAASEQASAASAQMRGLEAISSMIEREVSGQKGS